MARWQTMDVLQPINTNSFADPDPGYGAFLTLDPRSGMDKKSGSESGMNNPNHNPESLETIFLGLKYLNSLMWIRDGKKFNPG
jgi:hypothetical protein